MDDTRRYSYSARARHVSLWRLAVDFDFQTDEQSLLFCQQIAQGMVAKYNVNYEDAIRRINRTWAGLDFRGENGHDIYHWSVANWVDKIYEGYEDLKIKGLTDLPKAEIVARRRRFIEQGKSAFHFDFPSIDQESNSDE
jgi:hypothetical protein